MPMIRTIPLAGALLATVAWAQPAPPPPALVTTAEPAATEQAPEAAQPPPPEQAPDRQQRARELLEVRIEQVTRGNRVTEVRVTGADGAPRYTMENRDARERSPLDGQRPGLSAPNFLNLEF
jgi:hypothetical protein